MDNKNLSAEDKAAAEAADKKIADDKAKADADALALSQDPLKKERDRIEKKGSGRTHKEKLLFSKKKIDEELAALEGDDTKESDDLDLDDDKPMTVGDFKRIEQKKATKTAVHMADDIEDEDERELVKHHISNTIKPSGNPAEDLKNARAIVNSAKNSQIIEEVTRKRETTKTHSSAAGAAAKKEGDAFVPTAEEASFMQGAFGLTEKDILDARKKEQAARKD